MPDTFVCNFSTNSPTLRAFTTLILALTLSIPALQAAPVVVDEIAGFKGPTRIALDNSGNIYVTDLKKGEVAIFDATGEPLQTLIGPGAPLGLAVHNASSTAGDSTSVDCDNLASRKEMRQLLKQNRKLRRTNPEAIDWAQWKQEHRQWRKDTRLCRKLKRSGKKPATAKAPVVYVGDQADGSVQIYENGAVRVLGNGAGEFLMPNGIAVTSTQDVYVVDSEQHQVKVYDAQGDFKHAFGAEGSEDDQLNFPSDIVLNEALGEVYVTDFWNERVTVFGLAGSWLRHLPTPANEQGDPIYLRPTGLGIDPAGNLYIVDNALSTVTVVNPQGVLQDVIGYENDAYWTGQLNIPLDVATDGNRVYVISSQDQKVVIFEGVAP